MLGREEVRRALQWASECPGVINALWRNPVSRPSLRWFKELKRSGIIPFIKVRRLVFFDPVAVRRALDRYSKGGQ